MLYVLLFFFFFYCYRDHRDLHSFPTRRSSDLPTWPSATTTAPVSVAASITAVGLKRRAYDSASHRMSRPDRKSTRLNSSHRCISYAVFCLKKKKKNKNTQNSR